MTSVSLEQAGNVYTLRCEGHAKGSPEVCAAVSCLVYTLAGWLRNTEETQILGEAMESGEAVLSFTGGAAGTAFELMRIGFLQLEKTYRAYLRVTEKIF